MTARGIITMASSAGVVLSVQAGKLRYVGDALAVESILPALREHKGEVIRELTGRASALPAHVRAGLSLGGYELPAWTREACKLFLDQLKTEWPGFKVNGWHGLAMPGSWPVEFMDAAQSVYVLSLQESVDATQAQGRGFGRIGQKNAARGILAQNIQHGGNRYVLRTS